MHHRWLLFLSFVCFSCIGLTQIEVETITNQLDASGGVTLGPDGFLYVADFGQGLQNANGQRVWKISPDGSSIESFALGLQGASGNDFDGQGNLFQSNIGGGFVSKITPEGNVSTFATQSISCPVGIAVDADDHVYVCNCCGQFGNTIRKITPEGSVSLFSSGGLFQCPNGITIDADDNLYVSNFNNGTIVKILPSGEASFFVSIPGGNNGHITYSKANNVLYATSHGSSRIYQLSLDGELKVLAGSGQRGNTDGPADQATFSRPNGIAVSVTGDTLWVNSSIPTTNVGLPLNPSVVRMITNVHDFTNATNEVDDKSGERFRISPNPADDVIRIACLSEGQTSLRYELRNPTQQIVLQGRMQTLQANQSVDIPIAHLSTGLYFLHITSDGGEDTALVVKR